MAVATHETPEDTPMPMNKDPDSWIKVKAREVCAGSTAQAQNVLQMALEDIATLAHENLMLRNQLRAVTTPKPRHPPRKTFEGGEQNVPNPHKL